MNKEVKNHITKAQKRRMHTLVLVTEERNRNNPKIFYKYLVLVLVFINQGNNSEKNLVLFNVEFINPIF